MKINRLSAREVATAKPPHGKTRVYVLDGGGLFLQVTKSTDDKGKDPVLAARRTLRATD